MTTAWVNEVAASAELLTSTRSGVLISNAHTHAQLVVPECTHVHDIVSKLRSPTAHAEWERQVLATEARELQQKQEREQAYKELAPWDWRQIWKNAFGAGMDAGRAAASPPRVTPPGPVLHLSDEEWNEAVARWASAVTAVQTDVHDYVGLQSEVGMLIARLAGMETEETARTKAAAEAEGGAGDVDTPARAVEPLEARVAVWTGLRASAAS